MDTPSFTTLSEAVNYLTANGYKESFQAGDKFIKALYSKREYRPADLTIEKVYRFEGMTNPSDQTSLFAISAKDGTKGTLVMSYSSEHAQNVALIRKIKRERD